MLELGVRAAVELWLQNEDGPASVELPAATTWGEMRTLATELQECGYRVEERRYLGTGRVVLEVSYAAPRLARRWLAAPAFATSSNR